MSANNWNICPRCFNTAKDRLVDVAREVTDGYGILSVEKFSALQVELAKGVDEETYRTFREDYEIYGASTGLINVGYSGHCTECDCGVDFKFIKEGWS